MTGPRRTPARTFVELADTLVADFDLIDFLHLLTQRCQEALEVDAVGLLLADNHGTLDVVAASDERTRTLESRQLRLGEGPCFTCFHTGTAVRCPDLADETEVYPRFAQLAIEAGFGSVHALPMRLRENAIGGLNLFTARTGTLDEDTLDVGQAMADVATIGLLHERTMRQQEILAEQLQSALNSRLTIEQAKGIVAERVTISVEEAFSILRRYARNHNQRLGDVARAVVKGDTDVISG